MRRRLTIAVAVLFVLGVIGAGIWVVPRYWEGHRFRHATAGDVHIFVDESDLTWSYAFVLGREGVFAAVAPARGYAERYYLCAELPGALAEEAIQWRTKPSEVKPPFPHDGGPWFFRVRIPSDPKSPDTAQYFKNTNAPLQDWLVRLRSEVVTDGNRVAKPPAWVVDDPRIRARLLLQGE